MLTRQLPPAGDQMNGRRQRGKRREDAILDAARVLFIERGYRGTTLEAIISEAGGSRETIYRAFGGKRGLLSAIISQVGDPIAAGLDEQDEDTPPSEVLRTLASQLMGFWTSADGRALNRLVFSEGMEAPEIIEVWYNSAVGPSVEALTRYLERQKGLGRFTTPNAATTARQFLLLLMAETAFTGVVEAEEPSHLDTVADQSVSLFLKR